MAKENEVGDSETPSTLVTKPGDPENYHPQGGQPPKSRTDKIPSWQRREGD